MSAIKKILRAVEQAGETKGSGFGIDVTDLVGKDLLNPEKGDYANVGAGINTEMKKPFVVQCLKRVQ